MRRDLTRALAHAADAPGCLGAGIGNAHGLLVERAGSHGGLSAAAVAAALAERPGRGMELLLDEEVGERMLVGGRHSFFVLPLHGGRYFVYAVASVDVRAAPLRAGLRAAVAGLEPLLRPGGLLQPRRQGLDQRHELAGGRAPG